MSICGEIENREHTIFLLNQTLNKKDKEHDEKRTSILISICEEEEALQSLITDINRKMEQANETKDIECYNCRGTGIVYEVEPYPGDPDDVGVDAESCDQCGGVGRLQSDWINER
jgi:hypothetical protein